jgi:hypothetical protein
MSPILKVGNLTKIFIWRFGYVCGLQYEEGDLKCGLQGARSSTIMRLLTQRCQTVLSEYIQYITFHKPIFTLPLPF